MDSQEKLNQLFQKAREEQPQLSFEATKEKLVTSLNDSKGNWIKQLLTFKNCVIMITSILSLVAVFYFGTGTTANIETINIQEKIINKEVSSALTERKLVEQQKENEAEDFAKAELNQEDSTENVTTISNSKRLKFKPVNLIYHPLHPNDLLVKSESIGGNLYPVLNKEQIKGNDKQKKKMLKALAKLKSEDYVYMPSGTMLLKGKNVSFHSFYMQATEVSNLEYRTFLNDLILQKRYEDYETAKVDSEKWTEFYGLGLFPMNQHYSSHFAYNNYPVCNITRAGSELYCSWLQEEFKKEYGNKDEKRASNLIRLPSRAEWCYAASNGKDNQVYPWGDNLLTINGLFQANYSVEKDCNSLNKNVIQIDNLVDFITVPRAYNPTTFGLYNMSGNIAEMVYENAELLYEDYRNKENCGTAGGSWESSAEEIKIFGPDPYAGIVTAHPAIGFRICFNRIDSRL